MSCSKTPVQRHVCTAAVGLPRTVHNRHVSSAKAPISQTRFGSQFQFRLSRSVAGVAIFGAHSTWQTRCKKYLLLRSTCAYASFSPNKSKISSRFPISDRTIGCCCCESTFRAQRIGLSNSFQPPLFATISRRRRGDFVQCRDATSCYSSVRQSWIAVIFFLPVRVCRGGTAVKMYPNTRTHAGNVCLTTWGLTRP